MFCRHEDEKDTKVQTKSIIRGEEVEQKGVG